MSSSLIVRSKKNNHYLHETQKYDTLPTSIHFYPLIESRMPCSHPHRCSPRNDISEIFLANCSSAGPKGLGCCWKSRRRSLRPGDSGTALLWTPMAARNGADGIITGDILWNSKNHAFFFSGNGCVGPSEAVLLKQSLKRMKTASWIWNLRTLKPINSEHSQYKHVEVVDWLQGSKCSVSQDEEKKQFQPRKDRQKEINWSQPAFQVMLMDIRAYEGLKGVCSK